MKKKTVAATPPEPVEEWVEDAPVPFAGDENAEVVKLQVGESVQGEIIDIIDSKKWPDRKIYKIQDGEGEKVKVILGTTMLDRLMKPKAVGDLVKILRAQDIDNKKGNPLQTYKTFKIKKEQ